VCPVVGGARGEIYPLVISASLSPNGRASMLIMDGVTNANAGTNTIIQTYDGKTYTTVTGSATWGVRWGATTLLDGAGKVWISGGYNGNYLNDVWYTPVANLAGAWSQLNQASIPWGIRHHHQMLSIRSSGNMDFLQFPGNPSTATQMYRFFAANSSFSLLSASPPFAPRGTYGVANIGNTYLFMGGSGSVNYNNDIWSSTDDGRTWTKYTNNAAW